MLKRKIALTFLLGFMLYANSLETESENSLYSQINSAYKTNAFPTVIEYAVRLEKAYPQSLYLSTSLLYRGESLYRLKRYSEAQEVLAKSVKTNSKNNENLMKSHYYLGLTCYCQKKYETALQSFHSFIELYGENASEGRINIKEYEDFYGRSVYYSAKAFYNLDEFEKTLPECEYVISSGKKYSIEEYDAILEIYFESCRKLDENKKITELYEKLFPEQKDLFEKQYGRFTYYAADSFTKLGEYKKAYGYYAEVLSLSDSQFISSALQKAYKLASENPGTINENPAELLKAVQNKLNDSPEMLSEFYLRLAIDNYNETNYEWCGEYLVKAEHNISAENKTVLGLYKAYFEMNPMSRNNPQAAEKILAAFADSVPVENPYYADCKKACVRCYSQLNNWKKVMLNSEAYFRAVTEETEKASDYYEMKYWYALALYETDNFIKAEENCAGLENHSNYDYRLLYAKTLVKNKKYEQAASMYKKMKDELREKDLLDYAKILLYLGKPSEAYENAVKIQYPEGWYVTGIAAFNRKDWVSAEQYFKKFTASSNSLYHAYALFYCGYSQYRLGKLKEAYITLVSFADKYPAHDLSFNAYMTAASAALQLNNFHEASVQAKKAITNAKSKDKTEQAISLCANIYADSEEYDKAFEILAPYVNQTNEFGISCRFQQAQLLVKQKKIDEACEAFGKIVSTYSDSPVADDSAYRQGEIYFSSGEYVKAIKYFENYRRIYPNGKFADAAFYNEAECYIKLNNPDNAIVLYLTLQSLHPNSSYCYNAGKNLLQLYEGSEEYEDALKQADFLLTKFPDMSQRDNMKNHIGILQRIISGEDEQLVKKREDFENAGGIVTEKGRNAGTLLAVYLCKNSETSQEGLKLAQDIYAIQMLPENEQKEYENAGKLALLLAQNLRTKEKFTDAADLFITAARLNRMNSDADSAARCLYGAVEAYDAAGKASDARDVYDLLFELYPENNYTKQAQLIVGK